MTDIVIEDGSIVTGANSYATISGVGVYADTYGNSDWSDATETVQNQSLFRGMRYIEGLSFKGDRQTEGQDLEFPRSDLYDRDGYLLDENTIPAKLVSAVYEATLSSLPDTDLELQSSRTRDDYKKKTDIAGVIVEEWYMSANGIRNSSRIIQDLLKGYLNSTTIVEVQRG